MAIAQAVLQDEEKRRDREKFLREELANVVLERRADFEWLRRIRDKRTAQLEGSDYESGLFFRDDLVAIQDAIVILEATLALDPLGTPTLCYQN
jgi:hypothetical protein